MLKILLPIVAFIFSFYFIYAVASSWSDHSRIITTAQMA
jgi:hypothetical protein